MYPLHAAIRAHVLHQAGYKCAHCGVPAAAVPKFYDGREALTTAKMKKGGYPIVLLVDHILTLKAGGLNVIKNFQCLCETCNKHKSREDRLAIADYREGAF
jgi:5-methylcytosine-specific restriction endonuclease McrA